VWLASESAPVEGRITALYPDKPVLVETAEEHGLTNGDRIVLSGIAGSDPAALLNNRSFRIRVLSPKAFTRLSPAGRPEDGRLSTAPIGGRWTLRDRFHIRFPEANEELGDNGARLSRFRFDFTPTPPPAERREPRDAPDVRGYPTGPCVW
jgi:hypothetical protein